MNSSTPPEFPSFLTSFPQTLSHSFPLPSFPNKLFSGASHILRFQTHLKARDGVPEHGDLIKNHKDRAFMAKMERPLSHRHWYVSLCRSPFLPNKNIPDRRHNLPFSFCTWATKRRAKTVSKEKSLGSVLTWAPDVSV